MKGSLKEGLVLFRSLDTTGCNRAVEAVGAITMGLHIPGLLENVTVRKEINKESIGYRL
jgi:hypothetical protein